MNLFQALLLDLLREVLVQLPLLRCLPRITVTKWSRGGHEVVSNGHEVTRWSRGGLCFAACRACAEREHLERFYILLPEKWLNPSPESGLDCLVCAELARQHFREGGPVERSGQSLYQGTDMTARDYCRVSLRIIYCYGVWGLGFGVWVLGFGVWGLEFGVWSLGFGVWGLGCGVWGLGFGV